MKPTKITLRSLGLELITRSTLERPALKTSAGQVLELLGQLETLTQSSLPSSAPASYSPALPPALPTASTPFSSSQIAPAVPNRTRGFAATPPGTLGGTINDEYRPALQSPALVQALMRMKMKPRPPSPITSSSTSFSHAKVPKVEAQPKASSSFERSQTTTKPILRSDTRKL